MKARNSAGLAISLLNDNALDDPTPSSASLGSAEPLTPSDLPVYSSSPSQSPTEACSIGVGVGGLVTATTVGSAGTSGGGTVVVRDIAQARRPYSGRTSKNFYPCPLAAEFSCPDYFTTSGHAARHAKKHTGRKDAICPECSKAFTRKDNMEQHRRTHRNAMAPPGPMMPIQGPPRPTVPVSLAPGPVQMVSSMPASRQGSLPQLVSRKRSREYSPPPLPLSYRSMLAPQGPSTESGPGPELEPVSATQPSRPRSLHGYDYSPTTSQYPPPPGPYQSAPYPTAPYPTGQYRSSSGGGYQSGLPPPRSAPAQVYHHHPSASSRSIRLPELSPSQPAHNRHGHHPAQGWPASAQSTPAHSGSFHAGNSVHSAPASLYSTPAHHPVPRTHPASQHTTPPYRALSPGRSACRDPGCRASACRDSVCRDTSARRGPGRREPVGHFGGQYDYDCDYSPEYPSVHSFKRSRPRW